MLADGEDVPASRRLDGSRIRQRGQILVAARGQFRADKLGRSSVPLVLYQMKTNATRILDGLGIPYTLREYEVDPNDLSAETVASKIGLPAEQAFKTLVARGDRGGVYLAIIPGNMELDAKALARVTGDRRVELVPLREVQQLTGYIRGGVTALGGKRDYPVYADEMIELFDVVSISAGVRGTQILIAPADYLRVTHASVVAIAREK